MKRVLTEHENALSIFHFVQTSLLFNEMKKSRSSKSVNGLFGVTGRARGMPDRAAGAFVVDCARPDDGAREMMANGERERPASQAERNGRIAVA